MSLIVSGSLSPMTKAAFWAGFCLLAVGLVWLFKGVLTPFILGIAIAYLLDPVMRRFETKQVPRWATALIILTVFFATMALLFVAVAPMLFKQVQMLIERAPNYIQNLMDFLAPYLTWMENRFGEDYIEQINTYIKDSAGQLMGTTGAIVGSLATGGRVLLETGTTMVLTPLVAFFMMKEWPHITAWVESLYPRQHAALIAGLLNKIDRKVAGFIRGQIIVAFILGGIYAIALTIAGLNYGFLIGIGAGLFSIIPLVGSTLGLVVGMAVAWFQTGDFAYTAIIAGIFMGGQFIEGNFLAPKVVGDSTGLHPLWVMFALLAGGSLLGLTGMLIAVPAAAVVGVLAGFAIDQYKQSPLYLKEPEEPIIILPEDVASLPPVKPSLIITDDPDISNA